MNEPGNGPKGERDAAPLTAALLARKGAAAPAGAAPRELPRVVGDGQRIPRATTLMRRASVTRVEVGGSDESALAERARVTLRLDEARHLRLKLAAAHLQQSIQDILTVALDRYLDQVTPEILGEPCACLAARDDGENGR